jgi:RNA polymerase sigma-70 factor (ECF subfamily)
MDATRSVITGDIPAAAFLFTLFIIRRPCRMRPIMTSSKLHEALDLCAGTGAVETPADTRTAQDEVLFLFDTCGPSLLRYVRSLGVEAATAQDVVQEVFLALFHHVRRERPRDNMKGWLFKVAHNLSLKHRQKLKRRETDIVSDVELAELAIDPSLNPEQHLAEEQRQVSLRSVMRALPERDRQCLYLRAEGLRYREIADVLGISLGSVAKSVTRALARLANV